MSRSCVSVKARLFASLAVLALAGCGGGSGHPPTHPVSGTITYQGKAVADAVVTFHPEDGGRPATGRTSSDGKFTLTTFNTGDGAVEGTCAVTVALENVIADTASDAMIESADAYAAPEETEDAALPAKYGSQAESGLTYTIQAGPNDFNITLE